MVGEKVFVCVRYINIYYFSIGCSHVRSQVEINGWVGVKGYHIKLKKIGMCLVLNFTEHVFAIELYNH